MRARAARTCLGPTSTTCTAWQRCMACGSCMHALCVCLHMWCMRVLLQCMRTDVATATAFAPVEAAYDSTIAGVAVDQSVAINRQRRGRRAAPGHVCSARRFCIHRCCFHCCPGVNTTQQQHCCCPCLVRARMPGLALWPAACTGARGPGLPGRHAHTQRKLACLRASAYRSPDQWPCRTRGSASRANQQPLRACCMATAAPAIAPQPRPLLGVFDARAA